MAGPRALVLPLLVILLCLCFESEAGKKKKKPCKYNGKKFKAGNVIDTLEDNCVELRCSKKGKKGELKPIKNCNCASGECSPTKLPCTDLLGKCQFAELPCSGEVYTGPEFCPNSPLCSCCTTIKSPKPTDGDCNCDYSTLGSSHTMNKYSGPDGSCGVVKKTGLTDDEIKIVLKTHNDLREKVAKGEEKEGSPGPQPGATNMFELKWNCELAEVAQRWAERCKLGHDKGVDRKICNKDYYVGQNAFMEWHFSAASAWKKAITNWYGEVKDMPKSLVGSFGSNPTGKVIGHYTQVVWAGTYEIGCGGIHFPATLDGTTYEQSKVYVCNYGVGGNMGGSEIYESGSAASNCPNGVSSKYPGLCAPPS